LPRQRRLLTEPLDPPHPKLHAKSIFPHRRGTMFPYRRS
jgi:hypothetical protein